MSELERLVRVVRAAQLLDLAPVWLAGQFFGWLHAPRNYAVQWMDEILEGYHAECCRLHAVVARATFTDGDLLCCRICGVHAPADRHKHRDGCPVAAVEVGG